MKKENSVINNVQFLLNQYKLELKFEAYHEYEKKEMIENIIDELQTIIDLNKTRRD